MPEIREGIAGRSFLLWTRDLGRGRRRVTSRLASRGADRWAPQVSETREKKGERDAGSAGLSCWARWLARLVGLAQLGWLGWEAAAFLIFFD